jgi:hypothetical protein
VKDSAFPDLRTQGTEHGPHHKAEVEIQKGSEKRRPMAGIFEIK